MSAARPATPRPSRPRWRLAWRPVLRRARWALGAAAIAAPAIYLYQAGLPAQIRNAGGTLSQTLLAASGRLGLMVGEVFVEGRDETPAANILAVLDVHRGAPILGFDPAAAKAELERLPWVRSAAVERRLPDTIYVRISERRPLALWQRHSQLALIDRDGNEIPGVDIRRFAHLPLVVGEDAPPHAAALVALLATEPELQRRVSAAQRVGGRRWNLRLDNGVDVRLPEVNPGAAWLKLAEMVRADKILDRNINLIDLQQIDRMIVRVVREPPATAPGSGTPAKRTPAGGRPT